MEGAPDFREPGSGFNPFQPVVFENLPDRWFVTGHA